MNLANPHSPEDGKELFMNQEEPTIIHPLHRLTVDAHEDYFNPDICEPSGCQELQPPEMFLKQ
ncbi:hypothetical protein STEG23_032205, partial [Scotinomys teguina]